MTTLNTRWKKWNSISIWMEQKNKKLILNYIFFTRYYLLYYITFTFFKNCILSCLSSFLTLGHKLNKSWTFEIFEVLSNWQYDVGLKIIFFLIAKIIFVQTYKPTYGKWLLMRLSFNWNWFFKYLYICCLS